MFRFATLLSVLGCGVFSMHDGTLAPQKMKHATAVKKEPETGATSSEPISTNPGSRPEEVVLSAAADVCAKVGISKMTKLNAHFSTLFADPLMSASQSPVPVDPSVNKDFVLNVAARARADLEHNGYSMPSPTPTSSNISRRAATPHFGVMPRTKRPSRGS